MKKLLMMLLALTMLFSWALAETAAGTVTDFGDFTLACDPNYAIIGEKKEGETWFVIYPAMGEGDTATNFNCVWGTEDTDITAMDDETLGVFLEYYAGQLKGMYESLGLEVNEVKVVGFDKTTIDGASTLHVTMTVSVNYMGMGLEMVLDQWFANTANGSYTFTGTASDAEGQAKCAALIESLKWK